MILGYKVRKISEIMQHILLIYFHFLLFMADKVQHFLFVCSPYGYFPAGHC
jgi:hypothetical protein